MIIPSTNTAWRASLVAVAFAVSTYAQIAQDHPELCGRPSGRVPLPPNITVFSANAQSDVLIKVNGSTAKIELPGVPLVRQLCPLAQSKLLVFGLLDPVVYSISIVNEASGALLDDFAGFDPMVSPDQHWLAYRAFHSVSAEISMSEQYRLYDLSKDAKENRITSEDPLYIASEGRVMYPTVLNSAPFNLHGLPSDQVHRFPAESFYWAPDSRSVVFADWVRGELFVVWVRIMGPRDQLRAYVHPVSVVSEACKTAKESTTTGSLILAGATIGGSSEAPEILVEFKSYDGDCVAKTMVLNGNDFRAAQLERHAPGPPRKRAVKKQQ